MNKKELIDWLLDSDPSIRWQVLQDLTQTDQESISRERNKIKTNGWGAKLLSCQDENCQWGGQLYNNKWLSTTYSLLLLRQMGLEPEHPMALKACKLLLDGGIRENGRIVFSRQSTAVDNGVTGMVLSILSYFSLPDDRIHSIVYYLMKTQLENGCWQPFPNNHELRYVFDTTLLCLEGLWAYEKKYPTRAERVKETQDLGREFLISHGLYKTEMNGELIHPNILLFSFPPRWHYDLLTALDYFQESCAEKDIRLNGAIKILKEKRNLDGTWNLQNKHPGKTFFEMEIVGKPSRWNTLRGLRVLKWWDQ